MTVEVLASAVESSAIRKGGIVTVRPVSWAWGAKEALPDWIQVTVTGVSFATARDFMTRWRRQLSVEVVESDMSVDRHRLRLTASPTRSSDGKGAITREQVESFLSEWRATVVQFGSNEVVCDVLVGEMAASDGFFDADVSGVTFSDSYDHASGVHTITAQYSGFAANVVSNKILMLGGEVLSNDGSEVVYSVDRPTLRTRFIEDLERTFSGDVDRNRWYIDPTAVDQVIASGGHTEVTLTQFQNNLRDALND